MTPIKMNDGTKQKISSALFFFASSKSSGRFNQSIKGTNLLVLLAEILGDLEFLVLETCLPGKVEKNCWFF
jgi:hypothetical protein